jgi:hypothetical protein
MSANPGVARRRRGSEPVGVSDPGDPQPDRLLNLLLRVPAQMG